MQENKIRHIEEDEIDLRELFKTIMKHKKFIIVFTALVTLGAVVYAYTKTPVYEVRAVMEIGFIKDNNSNLAIENTGNLVKKIEVMNDILKNKNAFLSSISVVKGAVSLVEIKVQSSSNQRAKEVTEKIVSDTIEKHQSKLDSYIESVKQQISNLSKQKNDLENEKNKFDGSEALKFEISSKLNELSLKISPNNIQKTALIGEVITNNNPIKPNKKLIVAVAFVTGFILSIFLVFFIEFIRNEDEVKS